VGVEYNKFFQNLNANSIPDDHPETKKIVWRKKPKDPIRSQFVKISNHGHCVSPCRPKINQLFHPVLSPTCFCSNCFPHATLLLKKIQIYIFHLLLHIYIH
jgi:hypothetical protein